MRPLLIVLSYLVSLLLLVSPVASQTQISDHPTLTWQDAGTDLSGFTIGRWVSGRSESQIASVPPTTFSYGDAGLTGGLTYCYHIYAVNRYGASPPSSAVCGTVASAPATHTLSVSDRGNGTVQSSPAGISCGSQCSASFPAGSTVALTATPAKNHVFEGWAGACGGVGTCSVDMTQDRSVSAVFTPKGKR